MEEAELKKARSSELKGGAVQRLTEACRVRRPAAVGGLEVGCLGYTGSVARLTGSLLRELVFRTSGMPVSHVPGRRTSSELWRRRNRAAWTLAS